MELIILLFVVGLIYQVFFKKIKTKSTRESPESNLDARGPFSSSSQRNSDNFNDDDDLSVFRISYGYSEKTKSENKTLRESPESNLDARGPFSSSSQRNSDNFNDDDDLSVFRISYDYSEKTKSENKTLGRWIRHGEIITISGYEIAGGFFYLGGQLKSLDGYSTEASLIDDSLPVDEADIEFEDESLGYWPKYICLSSEARGAYLSWISSGRNKPKTPIGYVFIYFYGLERRVLVDTLKNSVTDTEFLELFEEVRRLRSIYGNNRSFSGYSLRLLEVMCLNRPELVSLDDSEVDIRHDSLLFKQRLAECVALGYSIPAELALAWVKAYPEHTLRTPARRCTGEFSDLFKRYYTDKYKDGIIVKPNKTKLKLEYHPASSTMRNIEIKQPDLPDPSVLKGPVKKLIAIAEACTDALNAYSRYLGKKGTSPNDVGAILLLPNELLNSDNTPVIRQFQQWAELKISEAHGLVSISEFWSHTGTPLPERINKKESELIVNLASKAGYGVAPDPRFHHTKPAPDGKWVLFHEGHGQFFEPSRAFNDTGIILRLGAMVAAIDGYIDESEVALLHNLIDHDSKLSPIEKRSLHAYLHWCLHTTPSMNGIKARIGKLGVKEKNTVSHILISIALADGKVDSTEIKQLEKLYVALGLDKSHVASDIHNLSSKKIPGSSVRMPKIKAEQASSASTYFTLDEEVLALHESETNDVQNLLGAIFVDEEEQTPEQKNSVDTPITTGKDALDTQHKVLFDQLSSKGEWPRADVQKVCEALNLMFDGAIEIINDWAYNQVDAPVIDDDDTIYVDQEIVEELKGLKG